MMSRMLEPVGLDEKSLNTTLGGIMKGGVDYADLYFQMSRHESWTLEDGIIRVLARRVGLPRHERLSTET